MLGDYPESPVDMEFEAEPLSGAYRWSKRAQLMGAAALSLAILVFGTLAILLLGIPIALVNGLVAGNWQASQQAFGEIWRLSPFLLAAEFALAWLLVGLFFIMRRVLAKFGIAVL